MFKLKDDLININVMQIYVPIADKKEKEDQEFNDQLDPENTKDREASIVIEEPEQSMI